MPGTPTVVDQAFERCRILAQLIQWEYDRARANPKADRYVRLGVTAPEDRIDDAKKRIDLIFTDLISLINHLTILDMAASLEFLFKSRIATAIGEARKTLRNNYKNQSLASRENLISNADNFEGLYDITKLVSGDISIEIQDQIEEVRKNRNLFAHGTNLEHPPTILSDDARIALNELATLMQPI